MGGTHRTHQTQGLIAVKEFATELRGWSFLVQGGIDVSSLFSVMLVD